MDPWESTPFNKDIVRYPWLDSENQLVVEKIVKYLPRLKHAMVSCIEFVDNQKVKVAPGLAHLSNVAYDFDLIRAYVREHAICNVVYTGFHHGRCIINRPTGAAKFKKSMRHINLWLKKDLVGEFPGDCRQYNDSLSEIYMKLV
jgi:hypothetical protein